MMLETKDYRDSYFARAQGMSLSKCMRRVIPACIGLFLLLAMLSSSLGGISPQMLLAKNTKFPRKIWQSWKVDPLDFEEKDLNLARTWTAKNPAFRYEVLTDQNDLAWVESTYGPDGFNRLDIVYIYRELTLKIIKSDILRYLVMYAEGGVYADIDAEALRPVSRFISDRFHESEVDLVIGVEIDQPEYKDHPILGQKCQSFCQWTFMCKPGTKVMLELVDNIMAWLKTVAAEQKIPIGNITLDFDQVISGTGPSAFTGAILADMSRRTGRQITWNNFHNIVESKLVGNTLVLPVEAFAAGQGHSDSGTHDTKYSLVKHHYHASGWDKKHMRYSHPIYGMVEVGDL